jgi:hypothetical protein
VQAVARQAALWKEIDMTKGDRGGSGGPGGGAVFGLGFIGAQVWFWQQADGLGEHVVGALKGFVWPAFLVYDAFRALQG